MFWLPKGHCTICFHSRGGSLAQAWPQRGLFCIFWLLKWFLSTFGFQKKGTLASILAPKKTLCCMYWQVLGFFCVFPRPKWHASLHFCSHEGTLVQVRLQRSHSSIFWLPLWCVFWHLREHFSCQKCTLFSVLAPSSAVYGAGYFVC